jgi:hypothetical protein
MMIGSFLFSKRYNFDSTCRTASSIFGPLVSDIIQFTECILVAVIVVSSQIDMLLRASESKAMIFGVDCDFQVTEKEYI